MDYVNEIQDAVKKRIDLCFISPYAELTLTQAYAITNISPDNLKRRMQFHPNWKDAAFKQGKKWITTLALIFLCQERDARDAKRELEKKNGSRIDLR